MTFVIAAKSIEGAELSTIENQKATGEALEPEFTVELDGKTLVKDRDYTVTYTNNVEAGTAAITVTGKGNYTGVALGSFVIEEAETEEDEILRLLGATRFGSSFAIADQLKAELGVDKFDTILIASGRNFADALAGTYLAAKKNAPIILADSKNDNSADIKAYLDENLADGGKVYILGGEAAVSESIENALTGYEVERLKGKTRYETNLEILKEAGVATEEILIATGTNFADSLSASASGRPILLVGKTLTAGQKEFLASLNGNELYIIGGEAAVSVEIEAELNAYDEDIKRLKGKTRYETSIAIAEEFFTEVESAVLAYGQNFPDGLCGGPLAVAMGAPVILTRPQNQDAAISYAAENNIKSGVVLGGNGLVTDELTVEFFSLENADEITSIRVAK